MDERRNGFIDYHVYHMDGDLPDSKTLLERIQIGDASAELMLLSQNEPFLNSFATGICQRLGSYSFANDLKQEGALALLNAARQFDFTKGVKFTTYAWPVVKSAMLDCAAETMLPVTLPLSRYHQLRRVLWILADAQSAASKGELSHAITVQMSVSDRVAEKLTQEAQSLFASVQLGDSVFDLSYGGDPAVRYTAKLRQAHISELLSMLTPRERTLIQKYCGFSESDERGMTFEELAVWLNFNSPSAAEKAFHRTVSKLAKLYGKAGEYGAWRGAEKAVQEAERKIAEPSEFSTTQNTIRF